MRHCTTSSIAIPVFILLIASCTLQEPASLQKSDDSLVEKSFIVSTQPETRADLGSDLILRWEVGDQFSVFDPVASTGRIFTVTKVDGTAARISGKISSGEFNFSAVFPAVCVSSWSAGGIPEITVPKRQTIAGGHTMDSNAMIASALNVAPHDVIRFSSTHPLLKFYVGIDDVTDVRFEVKASADSEPFICNVAPAEGVFEKGDYYVCVPADDYAGGIKVTCSTLFGSDYVKSSANALTLGPSDLKSLGCISDGKKTIRYELFSQSRVAGIESYIEKTRFLYDMPTLIRILGNYFVNLYFLNSKDKCVRIYNINHTSVDMEGKPMTMSASVIIPESALLDTNVTLTGVMLSNHHTVTRQDRCPTRNPVLEGFPAWQNVAVIVPDYYGFGATNDKPQAFINGPLTAMENMDSFEAGLQLIDDLGIKYNKKYFNFGYSQGGLVAMANLKYVAQHPERGIRFDKNFVGSGPYAFGMSFESYITQEGWDPLTYALIYLSIISINETEGLGLDYSKIFKEPLLSHIQEWVLDKAYLIDEITNNVGAESLSDILTDDMMNMTGNEMAKIHETVGKYDLMGDWQVPEDMELFLFHSAKDDLIPYENFRIARKALGEHDNIHYTIGSGTHHMSAVSFFGEMLDNLN